MKRPERELLHMATAILWSSRSLDPRRKVGAVITDEKMRHIIGFGYNGPAKGVSHDSIRETPGDSGCVHAEENALIMSNPMFCKILFVTDAPCEMCAHKIINAGIKRVFYCYQYRKKTGTELLSNSGVKIICLYPRLKEIQSLLTLRQAD